MRVWPGNPYPLGATWDGEGVNFALFSENAAAVDLCLFDAEGSESRIAMRERTDLTWHVHLPDVVGQEVAHRESQDRHTHHDVRLAPGSHLAEVLGTLEVQVASWHHQAVNRLGAGLESVAWAEDATVEGLELEGAPWLLAVQWHPELQLEAGSPQRRLFSALVERAKARAN